MDDKLEHDGNQADGALFDLFSNFVRALQAHPGVNVTQSEFGPPLDPQLAADLARSLPKDLIEFYKKANGVRLAWHFKDWEAFAEAMDLEISGGSLVLEPIASAEPFAKANEPMTDEHFIKQEHDYVSLQLAGHCDAAEFSVFWAYESSDEPDAASVFYLDSSEMEWKATDMDFTTCLHVGISTGFNWYWLANFDFTCHDLDSHFDEDEAIVYEDDDEEFTDKIRYLARVRLVQAGLVPITQLQLPAEYRARLLTIADESDAARACLIETGMAADGADEFITEWRACVDTLARRQFQLEAE